MGDEYHSLVSKPCVIASDEMAIGVINILYGASAHVCADTCFVCCSSRAGYDHISTQQSTKAMSHSMQI